VNQNDTEEDSGVSEQPAPPTAPKQQGLFGSSGIELTEEELNSPAAVKFLRHINVQQENEVIKLRSFEQQFYDKRQECEIVRSELNSALKELEKKKDMENLQKAMIIAGTLLIGSLKVMNDASWYVIAVLIVIATLLIIGGMFPVLKIGASK
jgi:hypothetical protein